MELNSTAKGSTTTSVVNSEGSIVYGRTPEIQLYLEGSSLKIKEDEFYTSAQEKLNSFVDIAKKSDPDYILGLAAFLTDNGLKLSPVVLASVLSHKGYSFSTKEAESLLKTFNTPQRIAESIALSNAKILHLNNSFKKNILRISLENMSEFTLRKNKLSNRKIKTKDLIKLLRPRPQHANQKDLFKAIIEDSEVAKMKETESLVRVKSSTTMSTKDKIEYFKTNVDKLPINEVIRNLRFIVDNCNFSDEVELQTKVLAKIKKINDFRFLNIFDLIETARHVPQLESMLFEAINSYAEKVKERFSFKEDCVILFDSSGSMDGKGKEDGYKYFVLLSLIFNHVDVTFFSSQLYLNPKFNEVTEMIKKGRLSEASKKFDKFYSECGGGTALVQSTSKLVRSNPQIKNLVIISDEVSWEEGNDLRGDINQLDAELKNIKTILVNPVVTKGTVFRNNVLAMSSLTSSVVYNVMLTMNPQGFVSYIKNYVKVKE